MLLTKYGEWTLNHMLFSHILNGVFWCISIYMTILMDISWGWFLPILFIMHLVNGALMLKAPSRRS